MNEWHHFIMAGPSRECGFLNEMLDDSDVEEHNSDEHNSYHDDYIQLLCPRTRKMILGKRENGCDLGTGKGD